MYECGKLKKVIGNKILFPVILEQCELALPIVMRVGLDKKGLDVRDILTQTLVAPACLVYGLNGWYHTHTHKPRS